MIMNDNIGLCQKTAAMARQRMLDHPAAASKSIHWGSAFSCVEILAVLYQCILNNNSSDDLRDRFILSKGHAAFSLYTIMNLKGMLSNQLYDTFREDGSSLSELSHYDPELGIEASGGSLGMGLSYGAGLALLARKTNQPYQTYVLTGDGELDEGNIWEAIMLISQLQLSNLTLIVDHNRLQLDDYTDRIISWKDIVRRFEAFGFNVYSADGHDCAELLSAFHAASLSDKPKVIIANTVKGKGVSFMENECVWHDRLLSSAELQLARSEVKCDA